MVRQLLLLILTVTICCGQNIPDKKSVQSYPLVMNLTWGGASPITYRDYDMNVHPMASIDTVWYKQGITLEGTRRDSIWNLYTVDINIGQPRTSTGSLPNEWYIHTAGGNTISIEGGSGLYADMTDSCLPYQGRKFWQYEADTLWGWCDPSWIDGFCSDGTWSYPYGLGAIDVDHNGQPDPNEHPYVWSTQRIASGYYGMAQRLRNKTGWNDRVLIYWTVKDSMGMHGFNGSGWENAPMNSPLTFDAYSGNANYNGYGSWGQVVDDWNLNAPAPHLNFLATTFYSMYNNPACPTPYDTRAKNYQKYMRYTLGWSVIKRAYYMIQSGDGSAPFASGNDHVCNHRYDEFKARLGQPKGNPYRIRNNTCYVDFFDNGVVILFSPLKSSGVNTITIDTTDIRLLTGYSPPYYFFYGNMDTTRNTGKLFTSVTMTTDTTVWARERWEQNNIGDCLFLKTSPDTIIEPVIVDNAPYICTAGCDPPTFSGTHGYDAIDRSMSNPSYCTGGYPRSSTLNNYRWQTMERESTGTSTWTPNINRAGFWRVSEWHGHVMSGLEANQVPVRINYAGGYADVVIDQTVGYGQWNIVGTYPYTPTGNKTLVMESQAGRIVNVDAWKWEYVTYTSPVDSSLTATTISATGVGVDSAIINGSINPKGLSTTTWFEISTDPSMTTYTQVDTLVISSTTTLHSHRHNLTSNTMYYFRVAGYNVKGTKRGSIYNFTTLLQTESKIRPKIPRRRIN